MIRVQVESAKRRKIEGSSSTRRRLPAVDTVSKEKENVDPQVIPARKKKKTGKKAHDLNKNVLKGQLN